MYFDMKFLGHFDFSPQDGELRIAHGVTLDRENVDSYTLILGVSDAGEIPRSSTVNQPFFVVCVIFRLFLVINFEIITVNLSKNQILVKTRGITPKITSGRANLRGLTPGLHRNKEKSQLWRAVCNSVFNLIGSGIKP